MGMKSASLACGILLIAGVVSAHANTVTDFGFPPPGNVTWSSSGGAAGDPGGVTNSYSNFNPSAYGQLYFGVNWIDMGTANGVSNLTTIGAFGSATETWSGLFSITILNGSFVTPITTSGTFTATLSNGTWIDPSSVGISGSGAPLAVTNVTGNFSVTETFTVNGVAFNTWYNGFNTLNIPDRTDFGGDFWATSPDATPLPAALPLFVSGLGGLGLLGWRRRQKAQAAA